MALRLYASQHLTKDALLPLDERGFHHAIHVLRMRDKDILHLFNERDGEWRCELRDVTKKSAAVVVVEKVREPRTSLPLHLYFSPLKPDRQFFLIEKATELGVTDFHPIQTAYTQMTKINLEKGAEQALHAAQQCERLDIPRFHAMQKIETLLKTLGEQKLIVGLERAFQRESTLQHQVQSQTHVAVDSLKQLLTHPSHVLIGPEGGFSEDERELLTTHPSVVPLSLGENILRAETAALSILAIIHFLRGQ